MFFRWVQDADIDGNQVIDEQEFVQLMFDTGAKQAEAVQHFFEASGGVPLTVLEATGYFIETFEQVLPA